MPGSAPDHHHHPDHPEDEPHEEGAEEGLTFHAPVVDLGRIVATPGALKALEAAGVSPAELLRRHVTGDWGELDATDWAENNRALLAGTRLLSAYRLPTTGEKVWIITEWDRSVTTLLLPSDY